MVYVFRALITYRESKALSVSEELPIRMFKATKIVSSLTQET